MKTKLTLLIAAVMLAFPLMGMAGITTSTALEASHVISNKASRLYRIDGYNSKASAQWILIMNATSLPSDGAVTLLYPPIYVAATSNFSLVLPQGLAASTGIVVCNSSTGTFSKTIGSADCAFYAITE